jgi:hypothetical protein
MDRFFEWFGRNRKTIGYTAGVMNVITGVIDSLSGNINQGAMFLLIGIVIIIDAKTFK